MKRSKLKRISIVLLALVLVGGLGFLGFKAWDFADNHPRLIANFIFANYAHVQAGGPIAFDPDGFSQDVPQDTYGIVHNSGWISKYVRLIVPQLAYEHITPSGTYPLMIYFGPEVGERSLHVAGSAWPYYREIFLNERYILDPRWVDERGALATLVHEIIHLQLGNFIDPFIPEFSESNTQAATEETLSALCNYGNKTACRAFWADMGDFAKIAFRQELKSIGLLSWYNPISNLLWRDAAEQRASEKSQRHWAEDPDQSDYIYNAYYLGPYKLVVRGMIYGSKLDTGTGEYMPYDDAKSMVPHLFRVLLQWAYPKEQ